MPPHGIGTGVLAGQDGSRQGNGDVGRCAVEVDDDELDLIEATLPGLRTPEREWWVHLALLQVRYGQRVKPIDSQQLARVGATFGWQSTVLEQMLDKQHETVRLHPDSRADSPDGERRVPRRLTIFC